jgi:hypothetical protein
VAYEAWWNATEMRDFLLSEIEHGNAEASTQLEALEPQLEALREEYLHKVHLIQDSFS